MNSFDISTNSNKIFMKPRPSSEYSRSQLPKLQSQYMNKLTKDYKLKRPHSTGHISESLPLVRSRVVNLLFIY